MTSLTALDNKRLLLVAARNTSWDLYWLEVPGGRQNPLEIIFEMGVYEYAQSDFE